MWGNSPKNPKLLRLFILSIGLLALCSVFTSLKAFEAILKLGLAGGYLLLAWAIFMHRPFLEARVFVQMSVLYLALSAYAYIGALGWPYGFIMSAFGMS